MADDVIARLEARLAAKEAAAARLEAALAAKQGSGGALAGGDPGLFEGLLRSFSQGATLGFGDEIGAGVNAMLSPGDFGTNYQQIRDAERARHTQFAQESPWLDAGMQLAPGLLSGAGIGPAAGRALATPAGQAVGNVVAHMPGWMRNVGGGAAGGGLAGYGTSEADTALGTAADVGLGAGMGGVVGGVAPSVTGWLGDMAGAVGGRLFSSPQARGEDVVLRAMRDTGYNPTTARAALASMGEDTRLMDLGGQLTAQARTIHAQPEGTARETIEQVIEGRPAQHRASVERAIGRATGQDASAYLTEKDFIRTAREKAAPLYEAAEAVELDPADPILSNALKLDEVKAAYRSGRAQRQMEDLSPSPAPAKLDDEGNWTNFPSVREWDLVQRSLGDQGRAAMRAGKNSEARSYFIAQRKITDALDEQVPVFAEARAAYAGDARIASAVASGRKFSRMDDAELNELMADMTPSERAGFAVGAADTLRRTVDSAAKSRDVTKLAALNSPLAMRNLAAVVGDDAADQFAQTIRTLSEQAAARQLIGQRSPTADIMLGSLKEGNQTASAVADVATGGLSAAARNIADWASNRKLNPETSAAAARLLTSSNPQFTRPAAQPVLPGWGEALQTGALTPGSFRPPSGWNFAVGAMTAEEIENARRQQRKAPRAGNPSGY